MRTVNCFSAVPQDLQKPIAVTIGSYDGIHLGHQSIFKRLNELGKTSVVVTFANHPSEILLPEKPVKLIYPVETKLRLLEECDIDLTVLLTFSKETASNTYDQFLLALREYLPYDFLVLGPDARLGKGRTGTPEVIKAFAKSHGFSVEYLDKFLVNGVAVSSQLIRRHLDSGDTKGASKLLGRDYTETF